MDENLKNRINELKAEIDALRPLDKDTEGRIHQKFRLEWNFHSNNIEGNSLTFGETKTFLLHGITADGKPLKDHLDIKGHNQALEMLEDIVKDGRDLSENFVREMHQVILHEPYDKPAITPEGLKVSRRIDVGSYKTKPNHVITKTGETFYFAKPEETPAMMNDLMAWFNRSIIERVLHPVELAALLHYKFIRIHPFDDGNGRISRILMNLTLMKFGFPPVIIKTQKKEEYYRALQQADGGDTGFFVDYITKLEIDSLELYLRGAKGESIDDNDDIDKTIALFKHAIQSDSTISSFRSIENQTNLVEKSLKPLLLQLANKLSNFDDLFSAKKHNLWIGSRGSVDTSEESLLDFFHRQKNDTDFVKIRLEMHWRDLLNIADDQASVDYSLFIDFTKANYQITCDGLNQNHITKNYQQQLTEQEIQNIIVCSVKHVMKQIEEISK